MTLKEYQDETAYIAEQIRVLHKRQDALDSNYFMSVTKTLRARGIVPGTPITIYQQPLIFYSVKRNPKTNAIMACVYPERKDGTRGTSIRHTTIQSADDIQIRKV